MIGLQKVNLELQYFRLLLMTITLKQFSHFILDFVNTKFVPLLVPTLPQHQKYREQWRQISQLIHNIDKVYLYNFQNCLQSHTTKSFQVKDSKQFKKSDNPRPSVSNFGSYDNFNEKKDGVRVTTSYQQEPRSISSNGKEYSEPRNKSYKYTPSNEDFQAKMSLQPRSSHDSVPEVEGFDKLLVSFRKLYQTFQSNHKKLLKQDSNLKQNMKVELHH